MPANLIRNQPLIHLAPDRVGRKKYQARRGITVGRAHVGLHHRKIFLRRQPENAGQLRHRPGEFLAISSRHIGLLAEVKRGSDAAGRNLLRLALHNREAAGKGRLVEFVVRRRRARGSLIGGIDSACEHSITGRRGDLQVHREAVRRVVVHRKPARRIHQVGHVRTDRSELDPEYRGLFLTVELPAVGENHGGGFALGKRLRKRHAHAVVLLRSRCGQLAALIVGDLLQVQRVVQLKRNAGSIIHGNEADQSGCGDGLRVGIDLRVNGVVLNINPLTIPAALSETQARGKDHCRQSA